MKLIYLIFAAVVFCPSLLNAGREQLKENIEKTTQLLEEEKRQHQKEKEQSAQAIKSVEERIKNLEDEIGRLEKEINSLNKEIAETKLKKTNLLRKKNKVENYFSTMKEVILENSAWLKKNIDSGPPFYKESRMEKIDDFNKRLKEQSISDSLRELFYYFTSEIDLSDNSDLYSQDVKTEKGEIKKAKFVRVGKIILAYRTNDGEESGIWLNGKWEKDLSSHCRASIKKAIEILEGRKIPELLKFPVEIENDYKD